MKQDVAANFHKFDIDVHWSNFNSSGFRKNLASLLSINDRLSPDDYQYIKQFSPDLILSWWGLSTYSSVKAILENFENIPYVPIVCSYPNAYTSLYFAFEKIFWKSVSPMAVGYIFYSNQMEKSFRNEVGIDSYVPSINIIDPQPAFQFSDWGKTNSLADNFKIHRYDDRPHVIFSGTVQYLSDNRPSRRKDAVKNLLVELSRRRIHVFFGETDLLAESEYLHPRVYIPLDRFGTFSAYLNQFDAHLVIYNEFNKIIRKRVANGLGTRYSFAQTAVCPIAASSSSLYSIEEFKRFGIGFSFDSIDDLSMKLNDSTMLQNIRANILHSRSQLTFESRYEEALSNFLERVVIRV